MYSKHNASVAFKLCYNHESQFIVHMLCKCFCLHNVSGLFCINWELIIFTESCCQETGTCTGSIWFNNHKGLTQVYSYLVTAKIIFAFKCCVHLLYQQVQLPSPMLALVLVLAPFIWILLTALAVRVTSLTVSVASLSVVLVILKMLESDVKVKYT